MKIKTSELTGSALDWAVAKCEGATEGWCNNAPFLDSGYPCIYTGRHDEDYQPSTDWAHGGPIIERKEIGIRRNMPCSEDMQWEASPSITAKGAGGRFGYGSTPLIAAMRCYVASKLGDEIDVPEELR
jgi:hypothetical protein